MSQAEYFDGNEYTEKTLRKRVKENPRPAQIWLAGVAALVILEFGRILSGLLSLISAITFIFGGTAGLPGWVGGNVAGWFGGNVAQPVGTILGVVAEVVTVLAMFYVLVTLVMMFGVRFNLAEWYDPEMGRSKQKRVDRAAATLLLGAVSAVLVVTPVGGILRSELTIGLVVLDSISSAIPSITSREVIPNQGHRTPDGSWSGTFLGLSPAQAWLLRFSLVLVYAVVALFWIWKGYTIYREHYREADWTPRDDTIRRFRQNYWGLFGFIVVFMFIVLAAWAPAVSPAPAETNIFSPYSEETQFLSEETGEVESVAIGNANLNSQSDGQNTVGLNSYDDYDRYHPLGTTDRGQDMLTHLAYGARTSLVIGLTAIGLAGAIAVFLSLLTAYYKGIVDIATILASDTIISIPALLLVMMISVIFNDSGHFLAEPMDGGFLLALVFAFVYWPGLWRSIRGPSLQVAEQEWVDAAKSYGQSPLQTMRKHMAPYIAGYIMIYASLLLGGVIIFTAALTFLGLGINPPTPEWGRLIDSGQDYIPTSSWHVATVPGLAIVLVVTGLNALGDGIRDAIDPEADVGHDASAAVAGGSSSR